MKTLLIFILSILTYAQSPYPDTLFLKNGRSFPCLLRNMNESRVEVNYSNDIIQIVFLPLLQRISLEEYGTIYSSPSGFVKNIDFIKTFVEKRFKKIKEDAETKKDSLLNTNPAKQILALDKKWSFGILFIPNYSGTIYGLSYYTYPAYEAIPFSYPTNQINMEGQFSYSSSPNTRLTFNIMYTSTSIEIKEESHGRSMDYTYDNGNFTNKCLDLLNISLGFKYYFIDFSVEKVTAYTFTGIGKQFAFVKNESGDLYTATQSTSKSKDNKDEYVSDLNSPWLLNLGFGVEYFFNESLSLTSNIYFQYSNISATYNYKSQNQTSSKEYSYSEIITRIGVGVNFYF